MSNTSLYYPAPPVLRGGQKPTEWLESIANADEKKGATARAREARAIAFWLKQLGCWLDREWCFEPMPAGNGK